MNYTSLKELIDIAEKRREKIGHIVKVFEAEEMEKDITVIEKEMKDRYLIMLKAIEKGLHTEIRSVSGITGGEGRRLWKSHRKMLSGDIVSKAMSYAMAISNMNAGMGKIVAVPTAGAGGIVPGVLKAVSEANKNTESEVIDALFTAGAIGKIIAIRATLSGAEGGCQAECGAGAAMAAGGAVELSGGRPKEIGNAVAIVLKSIMGLVCDPVAGLVEVPCIKRNGIYTSIAISAADMALSGIESVIPPDEVIDAMKEVGDSMPPSLKETALGGIAQTPTALAITRKIRKNKG